MTQDIVVYDTKDTIESIDVNPYSDGTCVISPENSKNESLCFKSVASNTQSGVLDPLKYKMEYPMTDRNNGPEVHVNGDEVTTRCNVLELLELGRLMGNFSTVTRINRLFFSCANLFPEYDQYLMEEPFSTELKYDKKELYRNC